MLASKFQESCTLERPVPLPSTLDENSAGARQAGSASEPAHRPRFLWEYVALFLVIVLIAGIRFRLRDFPLERDEGEYAYAGQLILQGIPPYQLAYNMKLPGTYAGYAVLMAVFGQTSAGIHLGLIVINGASILLLFAIVRRLFDSAVGVAAGAAFGLFTIRPLLLGLAAHATHFVTLFALLAIYLLLKALATERLLLYFFSGLCFGLAFLMKQPGIFFAVFGGLYLCLEEWPSPEQCAAFLKKLASYSAGVILPYALTCLILWRAGVFAKFWFWTVSYARAYGSELGPREGLRQFANRMELQKEHILALWLLIVFGMAAFWWNREIAPRAKVVLALLACSFLAISVGFYYRGHYFIMAYPVLALMAGVGLSSLSALLAKLRWSFAARAVPAAIFLLTLANALYADRETYFLASPHAASRYVYGANPFPEAIGVGEYLREHSAPGAHIAVIGSEPEIYFYAHRRSATGYIYTYALVEEQEFGSVMQNEMIGEIESVKPEIVVYVLMNSSWLTKPHADLRIFHWADAYLQQNYLLEGIADGGNHDVLRWGVDAASYRPRQPEVMVVYRRRAQPAGR